MTDTGGVMIVIPARGGSKRLPRKNILPLEGKPLISWTIETALETKLNAKIIVTSEDEEILSIAKKYSHLGVLAHIRPICLSDDSASTSDLLLDLVQALNQTNFQATTIILLQPTSPLRTANDIEKAFETYRRKGCSETVVTVAKIDHPTFLVGRLKEDEELIGIDLSKALIQEREPEYRINGAVYVLSVEKLLKSKSIFTERIIASEMPRNRSVDIDTEEDFKFCQFLINANSSH